MGVLCVDAGRRRDLVLVIVVVEGVLIGVDVAVVDDELELVRESRFGARLGAVASRIAPHQWWSQVPAASPAR